MRKCRVCGIGMNERYRGREFLGQVAVQDWAEGFVEVQESSAGPSFVHRCR